MREQWHLARLSVLLALPKAGPLSLIDEDRRKRSDGNISRYKIPQVHMNSELTVTSGNPSNVCRDLFTR
jgi:hypothetical protein